MTNTLTRLFQRAVSAPKPFHTKLAKLLKNIALAQGNLTYLFNRPCESMQDEDREIAERFQSYRWLRWVNGTCALHTIFKNDRGQWLPKKEVIDRPTVSSLTPPVLEEWLREYPDEIYAAVYNSQLVAKDARDLWLDYDRPYVNNKEHMATLVLCNPQILAAALYNAVLGQYCVGKTANFDEYIVSSAPRYDGKEYYEVVLDHELIVALTFMQGLHLKESLKVFVHVNIER